MKLTIGQCRCGRLCYLYEIAPGLCWTADVEPLDAQEATTALLAGRELYRVTAVGSRPTNLSGVTPTILKALRTAEPASGTESRNPWVERPVVVGSHGCPRGAVGPLKAPEVETPDACPKGRENGAQGAARGRSVEPATPRRSSDTRNTPREGPQTAVCDACSQPMADGTYASVSVGELTVWAVHLLGPCADA